MLVSLVVSAEDTDQYAYAAGFVPSASGKRPEGAGGEVDASIITVADG